jgi:beta-galactosidase
MWGTYRGFLENGVQPDWVHIEDIDAYDLLYFPYPIMLTAAQGALLAAWVERGGTLIAEACPGYFGDRGHVGTTQPNLGLDAVFGAREEEVEFMPDIGDRIRFAHAGETVHGGGFLQSYHTTTGTECGRFADGRIAMVENRHGAGRALLIGTNPSVAYFEKSHAENARFFARLFDWSGRERHVALGNPALFARLHRGARGSFLWLINPTREEQRATVRVNGAHSDGSVGRVVWAGGTVADEAGTVTLNPRDALILELGA